MTVLKIYKTFPSIELPKIATEQSACFDIAFQNAGRFEYHGYMSNNKKFNRPFRDGKLYINSGERVMVPTGLVLDIPKGFSVRLYSRSGLSLKQGLVLINSTGIIDSDFVEEVFVLLTNMSSNGQWLEPGDRIAQAELVKSEICKIEERKTRPTIKTERTGGFGSTGISVTDGVIINVENVIT